jgi:Xaa-Pro aminopeptidase
MRFEDQPSLHFFLSYYDFDSLSFLLDFMYIRREKFPRKDLDFLLITQTENVYWMSGFWGSFGWFLWEKGGRGKLITDGRYAEKAQACCEQISQMDFVLFDADFRKNFAEKLHGNLGVEDGVSLSEFQRYKSLFSNAKLQATTSSIQTFRRCKTKFEIERIKKAQAQVDQVLYPFLRARARAGISERELAFALEQELRDGGRFAINFDPIIAFGENSARPHHAPGDRVLRQGDNILVDCGVSYEHYGSDMTRNFIFGKPDPQYIKAYEKLRVVQDAVLKRYTTGAKVAELEAQVRKDLGRDHQFFNHSLGHGVGLEIHEAPGISERSESILQCGEVVTCEPGIYFAGRFGIRIEDLLVVGNSEPQVLSKTSRKLLEIPSEGARSSGKN